MTDHQTLNLRMWPRLGVPLLIGLILTLALLFTLGDETLLVHADPIPPPEGYPKLKLSTKTVTPTLTHTGYVTLSYLIEIRNTGAYTAAGTTLSDTLPAGSTYNDDAWASVGITPTFSGGILSWEGDVGFDDTVFISYSLSITPAFSGTLQNTAVISHPLMAEAVAVSAETLVTDDPLLTIEKSSSPAIPGANKPMTYMITLGNIGQPAVSLPITITDVVPLSTTFRAAGQGGVYHLATNEVVWQQDLDLGTNETTEFIFSVDVGDVPSGTVISNDTYQVATVAGDITAGEVHTSTILDPIFLLSKETWPDPPGSNREMTYILTLLNAGSLATDLLITDTVPAGVTYVRGGTEDGGVVSWEWPSLDTGASKQFTYTVYVSDVADVEVTNIDFGVCSAEGVCQPGVVLTSTVGPPTFQVFAYVDPIAHKPGGGSEQKPVTPTLVVHNSGPGNALDAMAVLYFARISVSSNDLVIIDDTGIPVPASLPDGPECGEKCNSYIWVGDLAYGETITFTTSVGQSTIGGAEGTHYTATIAISDTLGAVTTDPVEAEAVGLVTHNANLIPEKRAPSIIGAGQFMTYTFRVRNTGLSTDEPPPSVLTDTIPMSVTVIQVNDGGLTTTISNTTLVSWTLPPMSPGDQLFRSYMVRVDGDLVSGTQIVNDDYGTTWWSERDKEFLHNSGLPVTTTVREVGLIDSYKTVDPVISLPGPGNVLTYAVHVVNTGPYSLSGVTLYDWLPWEASTYQRDAVATAGSIISDIVSVEWTGSVAAFSEEVITLTVLVDDDFNGVLTNTAVISHPTLLDEVVVRAVAYVTDRPVLAISKQAKVVQVEFGREVLYTIKVTNMGQEATGLVVTDTIPAGTTYVAGSASAGGKLVGDMVRWQFPVLASGESRALTFRVAVFRPGQIANTDYAVSSAEGEWARGLPVVVQTRAAGMYLPLMVR